MFADDAAIRCSGKNVKEIERKLNSDVDKISNWINANNLCIPQCYKN